MGLREFIEKNRKLWQENTNSNCSAKLLIEEMGAPFIVHDLAIQTVVLNKAKGYQPIWMPNDDVSLDLLKSYVPSTEKASLYKLSLWDSTKIFFNAFKAYCKVLVTGDLLSFEYDGIKYGDIVYDSYLDRKQLGTIKHLDLLVLSYMKKCIRRHVVVTKTIRLNNISAVLVSHRIGVLCGVMLRAALNEGCEAYVLSSYNRTSLNKSVGKEQMIEYAFTPTKTFIDGLLELPQDKFNQHYEAIHNFHINGGFTKDAKLAFSEDNIFYEDRVTFAKDYGLDANKKNIFVMLHAFTDHPHSHFKWMIFKDYADWFLKTLEFAKKDKSVNWIFKQHPSSKFYPIKDIDFNKLFKNAPSNVIFLDGETKLDTRSLIYISDAVITCLGSAGFEIPAMAGIPSITAADNHYQEFGFSKNPKTQTEYFDILKDLKNIKKISDEQQKVAKAVYMFVYYFSSVAFSTRPYLSGDDEHKPNMNDWFWPMLEELYEKNSIQILKEIDKYSKEVAKDDFKSLLSSIDDLEIKLSSTNDSY